jgi:Domain of unknown function (DUF4336)
MLDIGAGWYARNTSLQLPFRARALSVAARLFARRAIGGSPERRAPLFPRRPSDPSIAPVLDRLDEGLWGATAPLSLAGLRIGTRMTVVRLSGGGLWIHSPIPLTPELQTAVDTLGPVAHVVAPNLYHHLFAGQWQAAYPGRPFTGLRRWLASARTWRCRPRSNGPQARPGHRSSPPCVSRGACCRRPSSCTAGRAPSSAVTTCPSAGALDQSGGLVVKATTKATAPGKARLASGPSGCRPR